MVKKTNPSSDDILVFFDAAKGTMPKDHQDLKNNILRDAEKTNSELFVFSASRRILFFKS